MVATGLIFAAVFVPAGVGTIFNAVVRTNWGLLINLAAEHVDVVAAVAAGAGDRLRDAANCFHWRDCSDAAAGVGSACVAALNARIRAREVVRG